jgi:hypothetical protein
MDVGYLRMGELGMGEFGRGYKRKRETTTPTKKRLKKY